MEIFSKTPKTYCIYSLHTIHFSFQLKSPLEAVKHSQLLFFFTQMMITETSTK